MEFNTAGITEEEMQEIIEKIAALPIEQRLKFMQLLKPELR
jgi:hypothetical protein